MKQIEVQIREQDAGTVVRLGNEHGGFAPSVIDILRDGEEGWKTVRVNVPNDQVGPFIAAVAEAVEEAEFVVQHSESLPIRTPIADVRDRVTDVSRNSTLELVMAVLQSVGSWPGLLLYAFVSGLVAAYGVIFNLPWLLTAAMLIAPLGAPVMVCTVGVAVGDLWMVRRGGLRFVVALLVLTGGAAALGLAYGLTHSTETMEIITDLSLWSWLLGVAGGGAGAQALVRAERDSLVTATATGFLVAVSLSPPSAVLGLSIALGRWDYVGIMGVLLALTFFGILTGGWVSLRATGVRPGQASAERGNRRASWLLVAGAAALVAGIVAWQAAAGARFEKSDLARDAVQLVREEIAAHPGYHALRANASFTTSGTPWHQGEGLLVAVVVKVAEGAGTTGTPASAESKEALREAIRRRVDGALPGVRSFVDLSIVP